MMLAALYTGTGRTEVCSACWIYVVNRDHNRDLVQALLNARQRTDVTEVSLFSTKSSLVSVETEAF